MNKLFRAAIGAAILLTLLVPAPRRNRRRRAPRRPPRTGTAGPRSWARHGRSLRRSAQDRRAHRQRRLLPRLPGRGEDSDGRRQPRAAGRLDRRRAGRVRDPRQHARLCRRRLGQALDIVVHNECLANVDDPAYIRRITEAHRDGPPAIVIHCAMHSYRSATIDDWREFLGVTSRTHTKPFNIPVKIAATSHPSMAGSSPIG